MLNKLYDFLKLHVNFFQLVRKLVKKRYDVAQTPFAGYWSQQISKRRKLRAITKTIYYAKSNTTQKRDYQTAESTLEIKYLKAE
ncbi:MAG: hypothetical protein R6U52_11290 [Kosmotogaceae bacterium]